MAYGWQARLINVVGHEIIEVWSGGTLVSREFLAESRAPVRLDFLQEGGEPRVLLRSPDCGYRLELHPISERML